MKITELFEGVSHSLPGALGNVKVMSMDQFVQQDQEDLSEYGHVLADTVKIGQTTVIPLLGGPIKILDKDRKNPNNYIVQDKNGKHWSVPERQLNSQSKKSTFDEATALPAQTKELSGDEFQDYMKRIDDRSKNKTDKYKLPYIHRSSVVKYYDASGKRYREEDIIEALRVRPKKLLKQNEKMQHSNGDQEQFYNIGFAALVGLALDESTNKLVVVNTCPGAGSCKIDCFAMKGGKVQFEGPWLSDARILSFLLNDPSGFFNTLSSEISSAEKKFIKKGVQLTIRWHDAGDFFSPEYMDLAFKLANAHPNVKFYAYTKIAAAAMGNKPNNFIINWSEGANTSQEKQIKNQDPTLATTKNSRIVPSNLFYDLLIKDEKKNLVKGEQGQWQVIPEKLPELKQRLAAQYGISANSILSYNEWESKGRKNPSMKWNVIVAPGEPDLTANDPGVLSTLLLKH